MSNPATYRIGAVSYLNTKPLVRALRGRRDCNVHYDVPSQLAVGLSRSQYDVALVPIAALFEHPQWQVISDACIACRGPVWSVKLCSRVPIELIRSVAIDAGSMTSAILVQVLLRRAQNAAGTSGLRPEMVALPIDRDWKAATEDAIMLIGDRAMSVDETLFQTQWDLGEQWVLATGQPFVFAVWAARPGFNAEPLSKLLIESRDQGLRDIFEIAQEESSRYGLSNEACVRYLTRHLHFKLGAEELAGLGTFYQMANELGLVPGNWELNIHDCQTIG